jgi:phosphoribosyl 1,2-cyclic phosphodiesterase
MSLHFQSVCSSSSGNCLALWTQNTKILIDCGLSSMKRTRHALAAIFPEPSTIDAVLLTHTHSDHISYYPLRVLEEYNQTIRIHSDNLDSLEQKHFKNQGFKGLDIQPFEYKEFTVGDLLIKPFEVTHNPAYPTFGFQIFHHDKKIVIATDFCTAADIFENFLDADFIFVESNHDLDLLDQHFNPNSYYHMPNTDTANLLVNIVNHSKKQPKTIMLGHISNQRNKPEIAITETKNAFQKANKKINFNLTTAPLKQPSQIINIT